MSTPLIELIEKLPASRIVLLGDLMLDRYLYGNAERLAQDAPVPVLHFQNEQSRLGGAGRVVADLAALGAKPRVVGLIGNDETGQIVRQQLLDCGADINAVIETPNRPTIAKVRLVGLAQHRHPQIMMRLDYEDPSPIDSTLAARVLDRLATALDGAAALCIQDYNKGLLTDEVCRQSIAMARARNIPVLADPAPISDYSKYTHATTLKPNRFEASRASGLPITTPEEYKAAADWMLHHLQLEAAIITLDRHGIYVATQDGQHHWVRGRERQVTDIVGAGDMVLAMLTLARTANISWPQSVALANLAGGLECEKFGSVPITPREIIDELLAESTQKLGKQRSLDQLMPELERLRASGKKIVFTNGCFDLLHPGHVKYFQFAKSQGDILVVGVNTDSSISRLKGPSRPIVNQNDRLGVLEGLESINYLVLFDDDTPKQLIETVHPDVLVKGQDYTKDKVVGADFVESYGGKVALAPLIDGRSTSAVIQRILQAYR